MRKLNTALYPGSFDPLHNGHLAIIETAASIFDQVIVSVGYNPEKSGMFDPDERVAMITEAVAGLTNVTVKSFTGLVTAEAARCEASCLIKGIRSATDLDVEMLQAKMNYESGDSIPTLFLPGIGPNALLSSRYIREVSSAGGPIRSVVPAGVAERLEREQQNEPR